MDFQKTLNFLNQLKENNQKEWFHAHKKWYNQIKKDWEDFVGHLIKGISEFDPQLKELEIKQATFRINRDIRFSKDKSPYKTNLGAYMAKGGRKSVYAGYYIHIQPENQSFLAGGVYMPDSEHLKKIREEIDYNLEDFKSVIHASDFQKYFGEIQGEKVKTTPKGYAKDNPAIDYLRHKSLLMVHNLNDEDLMKDDFKDYALSIFQAMKPFNDFFNRALEEVCHSKGLLRHPLHRSVPLYRGPENYHQ